MDWNEARPLRTGPGRALALEMNNSPQRAYALAVGALEQLNGLGAPNPQESAETMERALLAYLRGLAAAAIVADAACGTRQWTGAFDFAVNGGEVREFLPPDAALLGTLMVALSAVGHAMDLLPVLAAHDAAPRVPVGQAGVLKQMQMMIATASQRRMDHVSERAEEASGI
ncbi:hypothetical protein ACFPC0_10565 [Streptomyces andamanensis]|uniref:Uncharacterized protein n=1 Tax=Streptomyces andamanensis TaxID=1565035 RepID=A0ABV8TC97_9ACTN